MAACTEFFTQTITRLDASLCESNNEALEAWIEFACRHGVLNTVRPVRRALQSHADDDRILCLLAHPRIEIALDGFFDLLVDAVLLKRGKVVALLMDCLQKSTSFKMQGFAKALGAFVKLAWTCGEYTDGVMQAILSHALVSDEQREVYVALAIECDRYDMYEWLLARVNVLGCVGTCLRAVLKASSVRYVETLLTYPEVSAQFNALRLVQRAVSCGAKPAILARLLDDERAEFFLDGPTDLMDIARDCGTKEAEKLIQTKINQHPIFLQK